MAFVMNLLLLLFSAALVCSDQSMLPLKSIKISENLTYDCIDIYKQPGLNHPLLKNHTIQMKPSVSRHEIKNPSGNNKTYKKKIGCPDGTVPILRNSKEYDTKAKLFAEKYFNGNPRIHFAGVRSSSGPFRGVAGWLNHYDLNIQKDQASYSQIYLGTKLNNKENFISAGLMVNQGLFSDGRVWSYGFWKMWACELFLGKDGKECYNTACPGFVQLPQIPIVEPIDLKPGEPAWLRCSIHQDIKTGNWWLTIPYPKGPVDVGYWPKELFDLLDNGANTVGAEGLVKASLSGSSPPMGTGKFPSEDRKGSGIFTNVDVLNSNFEQRKMNSFPIETLVDSTKCYGLRIGTVKRFYKTHLGFFFNYGGPGGNSC